MELLVLRCDPHNALFILLETCVGQIILRHSYVFIGLRVVPTGQFLLVCAAMRTALDTVSIRGGAPKY